MSHSQCPGAKVAVIVEEQSAGGGRRFAEQLSRVERVESNGIIHLEPQHIGGGGADDEMDRSPATQEHIEEPQRIGAACPRHGHDQILIFHERFPEHDPHS